MRDAFLRAAKINPAFASFQLYRKDRVALDVSGLTPEEIRLLKSDTATVFDWIETVPGTLHWDETGEDGTTARGLLTLYGPPLAPDLILAPDGAAYVLEKTLGADSLRAGYRLDVRPWVRSDPPRIRVDAP